MIKQKFIWKYKKNIEKKHNYNLPIFNQALKVLNLIKDATKILIVGDYDVDGVCGSLLLYKFLEYMGKDIILHLPNRFRDGYGLNKNIIDQYEYDLLITVDNGTVNIDEINYAKSKNKKILIIDHHNPEEKLPNADQIINPKIDNIIYSYLCGTGLVYVLIKNFNSSFPVDDYLDIVALATYCDIVPVVDYNHYIAKFGLEKLKNNPYFALKPFLNYQFDESVFGFYIGPYINACGRLGDPKEAWDYLYNGQNLYKLLDYNKKRKEIELEWKNKLSSYLDTRINIFDIYTGTNIPEGIIGILAARVKKQKPVFVLTKINDIYKCSARSDNCNLGNFISQLNKIIIKGGGHHQAGGFTLAVDKYEEFIKFIKIYEKSNTLDQIYLYINKMIHLDGFSRLNLEHLGPFGKDNELSNCLIPFVNLSNIYTYKTHLSLTFSTLLKTKTFIIYNFNAEDYIDLQVGKYYHIVVQYKTNKLLDIKIENYINDV